MRTPRLLLVCALLLYTVSSARAQDPPPPIGPFAVDLRLSVPKFPSSDELAQSRNLTLAALPGRGLGLELGAHVYPFTWKKVTFGFGGQLSLERARSDASGVNVTEKLTSIAPQLSLNFGNGNGWSYVSGGVGPSIWSIVPDGSEPQDADEERLQTVNYGGGARWFTKRHVAFHFDVRFHQIGPGSPHGVLPGSPRTRLFILGAGASFK